MAITQSQKISASDMQSLVKGLSISGKTITATFVNDTTSTVSLEKTNVESALGYTINASVPSNAKFTDTTYSNMTAATSSAAGKAGLVPAPAAGKQASFLRGDGTWVAINASATAGTATPKAAGTAAVGTSTNYAREDHVHPTQTTVSGNAGSGTKLATARTLTLDSKFLNYNSMQKSSKVTVSFNGSANATFACSGCSGSCSGNCLGTCSGCSGNGSADSGA